MADVKNTNSDLVTCSLPELQFNFLKCVRQGRNVVITATFKNIGNKEYDISAYGDTPTVYDDGGDAYECDQETTQVTADTHPEVIKSDSAKQVAAKDSLTHPKPEKPAIHKTFENVAFEKMLSEIASYYDLQVKFENNEDKTLRLYYEWNSHSSIENIVKELNQFENVNIELQQNELIVK